MADVALEYVQQTREGGWRICNSRVSLDSVIQAWREGNNPEAIATQFPAISPEQVYGAIAFYLHNRPDIDAYLAQQEQKWERLRQASETTHGPLLDRIRASRKASSSEGAFE
jgi:uncharacterized protein (DUF433 family)